MIASHSSITRHSRIYRNMRRVLLPVLAMLALDNLLPEIRPASQRKEMYPIFSFNSEAIWRGVAGNSATRRLNQAFLKGASTIAHGIDLLMIVESVASEVEFSTLSAVGFEGATGPGVKLAVDA